MNRSMLKVAVATTAFAVVHSALASRPAKQAASQAFGERRRNGLYRVCFIAQSIFAGGLLVAFIRRQASRELYHVSLPWSLGMHAIQVTGMAYATLAAQQVGVLRITGVESFRAWLGQGPVAAEPEAQGPALDEAGKWRVAGPFAWSRHPLNFVVLPILWLWPRMTTNLLAFNSVASIYLVIGSLHEEWRLRAENGADYEAYQKSGVPFFVPSRTHRFFGALPSASTLPRMIDEAES